LSMRVCKGNYGIDSIHRKKFWTGLTGDAPAKSAQRYG
jgi:hypothetical protein